MFKWLFSTKKTIIHGKIKCQNCGKHANVIVLRSNGTPQSWECPYCNINGELEWFASNVKMIPNSSLTLKAFFAND